MKNLAFAAICIGSVGLLACGGGGDGDNNPDSGIVVGADANNSGADAAGAACNPVANTGCPSGQKCTFVVQSTDPLLGSTTCAAEGTVGAKGACTRGEDGNDDCQGGLFCSGGVCEEICSAAPDSCSAGPDEVCVQFSGLFNDAEGTGLCQASCDAVAATPDCPEGESCYVIITSGSGTCAPPASGLLDTGSRCGGTAGTQGCDCEFLNGCAAGYGCVLNNEPMNATGLVCSFFCDTNNAGGPTCASQTPNMGPGPSYSCRRISEFYNNTGDVPPEIGMCVDGSIYPCAGCVNNTDTGCDDATCMPSN